MASNGPKVNTLYEVNHSRKGIFKVLITDVTDEWATGTIVEGETITLLAENKKFDGESLNMRISFCTFKELKK